MLGLSADDVSLGDLTRDDLSGALVEPVFTAASGVVIGPVETPLGQHVLMVNEITAAEMTPLADVRDRIIEDLKRENATDLVYDRISVLEDEIAAGATIEEAARVSGAAIVSIDGMDRNGLDIDGNVIEGIAADTTFAKGSGPPPSMMKAWLRILVKIPSSSPVSSVSRPPAAATLPKCVIASSRS